MCQFFSCISSGKGDVKFFTLEDIVGQMAVGNPKGYSWNSHTSLCHFLGILGAEEDKWNKWEYNPETKELVRDAINTDDDSEQVKSVLERFFESKNIAFLRNFYGSNTGRCNTGDWNTGDWNTGDRNTGHCNTGHCNTGDRNTGDWNTGDRNTGRWNTGDWNTGDWNTGHCNTGDRNTGYRNTGDRNTGHCNTGHCNAGDRNTGHCNTGHCNAGDRNTGRWNTGENINHFCTKKYYMLFDKPCTKEEADEAENVPWTWLDLNVWVSGGDMNDKEKKDNPQWETTGGYLKVVEHKEACKKAPKEFFTAVKKLKNFDAKIFKKITGLDI